MTVARDGTWDDFGTNAYAAPFWYYINGVKQTASGVPAFVRNARNGRLYEAGGVKAWYPAPGGRYRDSGTLIAVGQNGICWSTSVNGSYAHYMDFSYSWINPQNALGRASGFPVRCLQE